MMRFLLVAGLGLLLALPVLAQTDPGAREDAEAAQKKLLRAADQIDILQSTLDANTAQIATLKASLDQQRTDLDAAKADIASLKTENAALHDALAKLDEARLAQQKALLEEVSKIVADSGKKGPAKIETKEDESAPAPTPAPDAKPADKGGDKSDEKGFAYVVVKGDTLHGIAAAYQANGVHVTIDEIRKANGMTAKDVIRTGQKLFIPKK